MCDKIPFFTFFESFVPPRDLGLLLHDACVVGGSMDRAERTMELAGGRRHRPAPAADGPVSAAPAAAPLPHPPARRRQVRRPHGPGDQGQARLHRRSEPQNGRRGDRGQGLCRRVLRDPQARRLAADLRHDGLPEFRHRHQVHGGQGGPVHAERRVPGDVAPGPGQCGAEPGRQGHSAAPLPHHEDPPQAPGGHRPGEAGGAAPPHQDVQHGRPDGHRLRHQAGHRLGPPGHRHHRPRRGPVLPGRLAHRQGQDQDPLRRGGLLCQ